MPSLTPSEIWAVPLRVKAVQIAWSEVQNLGTQGMAHLLQAVATRIQQQGSMWQPEKGAIALATVAGATGQLGQMSSGLQMRNVNFQEAGMWLLVAREPRANAPYWPGRRWLAAIDAVAWPLLWVLLGSLIDAPVGIVDPVIAVVALLFSAERVHRALWVNHRYWFTTWRWGRIVIALMVIGMVLRLASG
jgi:hypothetical protein